MRRLSLQALCVLGLCLSLVPHAEARRELSFDYRYEQVWGAAIRMLRVDYGFQIQDRDPDNGYLLFDYVDAGRTFPGSLELLRVGEGADASVRVAVQVSAMPSYVERMIADHLSQKLLRDYGPPPRRVRRPAPPTRPDADADEDEEAPESDD
jgi:hypothetical protein